MPPYTLQVSPKTYYNFTFKNVKFKLSSLQVDKGFYNLKDFFLRVLKHYDTEL